MRNRLFHFIVFTFAVLLSVLASRQATADPPVLDLGNIPAYRLALEQSTDPEAPTIRQEIADGSADLAQAEAAALNDGILLNEPPVSSTQAKDAAALYAKWIAMRHHLPYPMYADPMTLRYQYTPDQTAAVQKLVDDNKDAETALMAAVRQQSSVSSTPDLLSNIFPNSTLRAASRQIRTEATLLALKGEWLNAVTMDANGFAIEGQAAKERSDIGYLVADAIEAITIDGLKDILSHSIPNVDTANAVISAVSTDRPTLSIKYALEGDALWFIDSIQDTKKQIISGPATDINKNIYSPDDLLFYNQLLDAGEARYLNNLRAAVEVADEPPIKRRSDLAQSDKKADALDRKIKNDPVTALGHLDYFLMAQQDDVRVAREQVLLAAAAALSIKAQTGSFPSSLPGDYVDPFSGKPLTYKIDGHGFTVYSIGPTGHFNGNLVPGHSGWESGFRYPAPTSVPVPKDALALEGLP